MQQYLTLEIMKPKCIFFLKTKMKVSAKQVMVILTQLQALSQSLRQHYITQLT